MKIFAMNNVFSGSMNLGYALNQRTEEEMTRLPKTLRTQGELMIIAHNLHNHECM